ncbi:unnamed protein product [Caenorhabditis brenneri]
MVHSSAFHPYSRPADTNPIPDVLMDDNLRLLLALAQFPDASKLLQLGDLPKQISPPIPAPALTPNPVITPISVISEQPSLQSPSIPNEKSRRKRTTFSQEQAERLEHDYKTDNYMGREKRLQLAHTLNLSENQVKTWFQNRRAKDKRDRKTENSSNTTHSRKSSPSRKSSDSSSPPPLMSVPTPFILDPSNQVLIATPPSTVESTTPTESVIQKVDQFPLNQSLIQNFDVLNNYLQSLTTNVQILPPFQSLLDSSPPPLFNPNVLVNFPPPLESAII